MPTGNEDIVARLRATIDNDSYGSRQDITEAANEIKNLREQNEYLKSIVDTLLSEARTKNNE